MDGNVLKDLEMVTEFVENIWRHGWVEIVHLPYQRKDEGPRAIAIHLAHHFLVILFLVIIFLFFSLYLSFLLLVTLFLSLLILFILLLFLLGRGVSIPFLGTNYIFLGLAPSWTDNDCSLVASLSPDIYSPTSNGGILRAYLTGL